MGKNSKTSYVAIALLLIFFLAQTASDAFMSFYVPGSGDISWLIQATRLHPLGAESHLQMGFSCLEQGQRQNKIDLIKQAITHLKQAIRLNPFLYQAHINLGKAYFLLSETETHWVGDGILSFKRAATIRGANMSVALDTTRLLFSLWPLLKEEDQAFAKNLVLRIMHRISQKDFQSLVDLWALYNRKIDVMELLIAKRPEFSPLVAQALTVNRQFNDQRRQLQNTHDQIRFQHLKRKIDEVLNQAPSEQNKDELYKMFDDLGRVYHRYDRLIGQELFPEKVLLGLRRRLGERLLDLMIDGEGLWRQSAASRKPVDEVVNQLIADSLTSETVFELEDRLEKSGYYREGDIKSFLAKQRIFFQTARYDQVIDQIETLQRQLSFVREDARQDMIEALFLLTEAYYQSRLLTMASKVLDSLEPLSPSSNRLLWLRYLIERVIAVKADATMIASWREQFAASRALMVDRVRVQQTVYLDDNREFTITLAPEIMAKAADGKYNLLELFVNGQIMWDSYLGEESQFVYVFPETFEGKSVEVVFLVK